MKFIKFLSSKTFLIQIALALVVLLLLSFLMLKWLDITTNHGDFETVPDLKGKPISIAKMELETQDLVAKIQDSSNYNPRYPKFAILEQDPPAGAKVKENRKVYLTLNPSGYRNIKVPNLIERTFRQAKPTLEALGFRVGKIEYENNLGKDMVLRMSNKGKILVEGDKLPKTSVIDLVLGNGKRP